MDIRPIRTAADHDAALARIAVLMSAETSTPEGDELDILATLVDAYELKHFPIETADQLMHKIESSVRDALSLSHPGVVFTDVWSKPRTSWCGADMVDVWAIYDGDIGDLSAPAKPSLATLIQDIFWNMGLDASPSTHLVAKADANDLSPEAV